MALETCLIYMEAKKNMHVNELLPRRNDERKTCRNCQGFLAERQNVKNFADGRETESDP